MEALRVTRPGTHPGKLATASAALILASRGLLSMHSLRTLVRLVRSCHCPVQSPAVAASALSQSQVLRVAQEVPHHLPCLFSPLSPRHLFFSYGAPLRGDSARSVKTWGNSGVTPHARSIVSFRVCACEDGAVGGGSIVGLKWPQRGKKYPPAKIFFGHVGKSSYFCRRIAN